MHEPSEESGDFLYGAAEITAFVNTLLTTKQFTRKQIYRLIASRRLPVGKNGERVVMGSKKTIREHFSKCAGTAA
jgi:hypothetical protein